MNESRTTCRICNSSEIQPVLSLGTTPSSRRLAEKGTANARRADVPTERGVLPALQLSATAGNGPAGGPLL